jgi:uncharacterized damage-inducible protein DinB
MKPVQNQKTRKTAMSDQALQELLYGKGAHVDPIACLEDVPADVAGRKVEDYPHSIWQIVGHLNYWMDYDLRRIQGELPPYPAHAIESWPSNAAPANDEQWKDELRRFATLLDQLMTLAASGPEVLQRHVEPTHPSHEDRSSSVEAVLWQTLVHNSYHIGQVALLRRCFGAWPPRRGSDTW